MSIEGPVSVSRSEDEEEPDEWRRFFESKGEITLRVVWHYRALEESTCDNVIR